MASALLEWPPNPEATAMERGLVKLPARGSGTLPPQRARRPRHRSNRRNPGDADLGRRSEPIDQLSGVMLKVPNVVELQFQFA